MIYVIATTPMKPESKDDFIKGHKACTAETLKEKGCLSYDGHGTLSAAVDARHSPADSRADLHVRRAALTGYRITKTI